MYENGSEYPIKVGSMLYTLVDPNKGHEKEYNRWYERDHFYAGCMIGPWLFAGSRWVATRELKDLRFPKENNAITQPYDAGSYVAIYWVLEGHYDDHFNEWAGDQVHWLYSNGRGFAERTHRHTVLYKTVEQFYRDEDPVPVELALDKGYDGQVSIAVDLADGVDDASFGVWLRSPDGLSPVLESGSPVASCITWIPSPREGSTANSPMPLGSDPGGPNRRMQLFFIEGDVRAAWPRFVDYAARIDASGMATVVSAAPFHKTILGTDTYVDQLW